MPRYIALIDGEAGAYEAAFPDCPGCIAMGETLDEAIANAGEALREWIGDRLAAGQPAPAAQSADAIRTDPAEVEAFEAMLAATTPLLLDEGRSVRVNLSLDAGALAMIEGRRRAHRHPERLPRLGRAPEDPCQWLRRRGCRPRRLGGADGAGPGQAAPVERPFLR